MKKTLEQRVTDLEATLGRIERLLGGGGDAASVKAKWAAENGFNPDDFEAFTPESLNSLSVTVPEAAEALGIGEEQTRRLLRNGTLIGLALGGRAGWRVSRESIDRELARRAALDTTTHPSPA